MAAVLVLFGGGELEVSCDSVGGGAVALLVLGRGGLS